MSLVRPAWSAGNGLKALSPWHTRQSSRPSSVCGITGSPPVDVAGSGVDVAGVVGAVGVIGVIEVVVPPQETLSKTSPSVSMPTAYQGIFFFICFLLLDYNTSHLASKGRASCILALLQGAIYSLYSSLTRAVDTFRSYPVKRETRYTPVSLLILHSLSYVLISAPLWMLQGVPWYMLGCGLLYCHPPPR